MKNNPPPKDIGSQIHRACFDYNDTEEVVDGEKVEDRIYDCWQGIHLVIKSWVEKDEKGFIDFIKNNTPDMARN